MNRKPTDIPAVRILPMSDRVEGFRGLTIAQVQQRWFLRKIPKGKGRFRYPKSGLNADPGTIVLFQFQARIIASAIFLRDEKLEQSVDGCHGVLYFDPASFQTFDPVDADAMRKTWPGFCVFGHVKQFLNPGQYPDFKRRLRHLVSVA